MMRLLVVVTGFTLLAGGCATSSEPSESAESSPDAEECGRVAQQASGYTGAPKYGRTRIERRQGDQRWEVFQREYERCMQARGHEVGG